MPNDFVKRGNTHQTHYEDLVLLGEKGLNELNHKIENFIRRLDSGDGEQLNTTVKIDGCLAPETIVKTTEGDMSLSRLIMDYSNGIIHYGYGFDEHTKEIKQVELFMPRVKNGIKDWCSIEFDNGSYIICTEDHPIKVGDDYIEAGKLELDTKIDGIDQF